MFIRSFAEDLLHDDLQPEFQKHAFALWWQGELLFQVALIGA